MRYRSSVDRTISFYFALLAITVIGSSVTLFIVRSINAIDWQYESTYDRSLALPTGGQSPGNQPVRQ